jgi:hypothetical protein
MAFGIHKRRSTADLIAVALSGAWREKPPPLELNPEEIEQIAPLLRKSGSAALVWRKASLTGNRLYDFQLSYKYQVLRAAVHEQNVRDVFAALNSAKIDALLVKGWAIARLYPTPALRPYGDLDLCVRAEQFSAAKKLLRESGLKVNVDLHEGLGRLDDLPEKDFFDRATTLHVGEVSVRVPSEEDHLRILCLHFLRHGGSRPIWLCDIALAVETAGSDFDWDHFYGADGKREKWLGCVISLARELLLAQTGKAEKKPRPVPGWLKRSIKYRWSRWFNSDYRAHALPSLLHHRFEPIRAFEDFYFRFDPVRATVELDGAFNSMPRLPYQLAAMVRRFPEARMQVAHLCRANYHLGLRSGLQK